MRYMILLAAGLCLTACATSPGRDCDTQEIKQVGKDNNAAQSQAESGVDVTGKQHMGDTVPAQPNTLVARGEGDQNTGIDTESNRSQAGAPVTYQGVVNVFPATAESSAGSGGPSAQEASVASQIKNAEQRLDRLLAQGMTDEADKERKHLADLNKQLDAASKNAAKNITMTFNMDGQISTQGVAATTGANSKPGDAKADADATETKGVPANLKARGVIPAPAVPDSSPKPSGGGTD